MTWKCTVAEVTASWFERVQNIENEQWDEDEVSSKLQKRMQRATDAVIDTQEHVHSSSASLASMRRAAKVAGPPLTPVDLRMAAQILAITRVATVARARDLIVRE